ncbi:MAG TPA: Gfo/Idh/MocA family oxidoreductase [Bryobacteraceae bacterium]|jgi:predicted dehydrogenase|nr:Gfo/Idh/MocA family oxidoreductase [Bryobacteraceae bacterium]
MKIAVIGLGFMGSTHVHAWRQIPGAELAAVASRDPVRLSGDFTGVRGNLGGQGGKLDFSAVAKYTSAEEAVRDPAIEAVDICLPTNLHERIAALALAAGKHVLVEKPMALDGASADRMIAAAERHGRILMAAQVVRFIPPYRGAADILRSGRLGPVRAAIFRRRCAAPAWSIWLSDPAQSGGGVFDLLIHDIDFCLHVFGKPEAVRASGYEDLARGVDWILAQFQYPGIGAVAISGGWHHPAAYPFSMEFTIVADNGTLEFDSSATPLAEYGADASQHALNVPDTDGYRAELEYFLDCATRGEKPLACPPEESAAAVKLAHLMLESRNRNGEKIACNL